MILVGTLHIRDPDVTIDDITFEQQTAMIDVHIILHP